MKPSIQSSSKLTDWFRKRTEGFQIVQWISYAMIFSVLLIFILIPSGNTGWRFYGTVLTLAVLLVINILWYQAHDQLAVHPRQNFLHWAFNLVTDVLVLSAIAISGNFGAVYLLLMQVAQFATTFGIWPVGAILGLINLAITLGILKSYGVTNGDLIQNGAEIAVGIIFVLVFVLLRERSAHETQRAEGLLNDLRAAHIELKAAQQKEKELAIAEERMRLARDIHDGLGHHLTVLSVQLQAAQKLVERNPQGAGEAIQLCRGEVQAALDEVRQSVGMMRQLPAEGLPLPELLKNLVHDFAERTGLHASFEQSGLPPELSTFAQQTLFRIVQEGLTNVQKHGTEIERILVKLECTPEAVRLVVRDDGLKVESPSSGPSGYGLQGLRERLEQLGGSLHSGPRESGGFELEVSIPLQEIGRD